MSGINTSAEAMRDPVVQSFETIEMRAARISDALHRWAIQNSGGMLWLAVDAPSPNADPLPSDLETALAGSSASRLRLRHPAIDWTAQPRWLPLNLEQSAGSALLQQSVERALDETDPEGLRCGKGRRIAGWLALDGGLFDALEHLGTQMIRRRPDCGAQRCLVRLHDPAVLWAVWHVLRPEQHGDLLGSVRAWWLLDPAGNLSRLSPLAAGELQPSSAPPWSAHQWEDIDNITPLNGALRQWLHARRGDKPGHEAGDGGREDAGPLVSRERLIEAIRAAFPAMRRGRSAGFACLSDMVVLATLAITVHPNFDEHSLYRQAIAAREQGSGDETLRELTQSLTEGDLHTIRRELAQGTPGSAGDSASQHLAPQAAGI